MTHTRWQVTARRRGTGWQGESPSIGLLVEGGETALTPNETRRLVVHLEDALYRVEGYQRERASR